MYWCKPFIKPAAAVIISIGFCACKPDIKSTGSSAKYFELKQFIAADSARLANKNVWVTKTVSHNGDGSQTRKLHIANWARELDPFSASDINKPAWRDSYSIIQTADSVIYTAKTPELVTRRMVITRQKAQIKKITISNITKNLLYQTTEELIYFPDSLYLIDKLQKVRLLGSNRYVIKGVIEK